MPKRRVPARFHTIVPQDELAMLRSAKRRETLEPFMAAFRERVMVCIAYMPRAEWPSFVEAAFKMTEKEMPTSGHMYLNP